MLDITAEIIKSLWILFPAYAANMFPVFLKGKMHMDFDKYYKGQRILGDGKTFEGFFAGILIALVSGGIAILLQPYFNASLAEFGVVLPKMSLFIAFMIGVGAMSGDVVGSFIKRRIKLKRGEEVFLLDQLDFIVGVIVFAMWFTNINIWMILIMLTITPAAHRVACIAGYKLDFKKEPW